MEAPQKGDPRTQPPTHPTAPGHGAATQPSENRSWERQPLGWFVSSCIRNVNMGRHCMLGSTLCWQANFRILPCFLTYRDVEIHSLKYCFLGWGCFAPHSGPVEVCPKWAALAPILPLQDFTDSNMPAWCKT